MKYLTLAASIVLGTFITIFAQTGTVSSPNNQGKQTTATQTDRSRILSPAEGSSLAKPLQAHAMPEAKGKKGGRARSADAEVATVSANASTERSRLTSVPSQIANPNNSTPTAKTVSAPVGSSMSAATQIYRVGVRDVLDIQLSNNPTRASTLFTVREKGFLEYPLAGEPMPVA